MSESPMVRNGLAGRCPACGEGALFSGYLKTAAACNFCGQSFDFDDAGDGPAVFVMAIAGFLVVFPALFVQVIFSPPVWVHALLWLPVSTILVVLLLRPFRGMWFGLMFKHDAHPAVLDDGNEDAHKKSG